MRKVIGKAVIVVAVCAFGAAASADTLWFSKEEHIREIAKQYSEVVGRDLPLKINEHAVWQSSKARGNKIHNIVVLSDGENSLRSVLEDVQDANSARAYWHTVTMSSVCDSPVAKAFVRKGGVVQTAYEFENGETIVDVSIDTCD